MKNVRISTIGSLLLDEKSLKGPDGPDHFRLFLSPLEEEVHIKKGKYLNSIDLWIYQIYLDFLEAAWFDFYKIL